MISHKYKNYIPMKKYIIPFVIFAFAYLVATWANYLVLLPDQPYLWWLHISFALLTGVLFVIILYFQDKKKEKKDKK
jgi:membrane protein implicated in regulation of membrane protease activity